MLEEKLSKLNSTIPELQEKDELKREIINKSSENKVLRKFKFNKPVLATMVSLFILLMIGSLILIVRLDTNDDENNNNNNPPVDELYLLEQQRRAKLYLNNKKNYYSDYLMSQDENLSEYTKYLINQNQNLEDSKEVEDIYYEVTIDYKNGISPYTIVVKKGEYIYPEVFSYTGYYFVGWFVDEILLEGAYQVTKDTYIYAKWNPLETCMLGEEKYNYYQVEDGVYIVKAYIGNKEIIEVPTYLNGLKVVGIEYGAYSAYNHNNQNITTKIIISEYVRQVKAATFSGYKKLKEIYFSQALEDLYCNAFDSANIEKIVIDEQNINYEVIDNCLIDKRTNALVKGCKNSTIPDSVKIIDRMAFLNVEGLKSIVIPNSVIQINEDAFTDCDNLETIIIPDGVKIINQCILESCDNLKEIYLGKNVEKIYDNAFMGCYSIEKIIIPDGNPYYETVDGCLIEKETSTLLYGSGEIVKIPEGVKIIASNAFYGRKNLEILEIGNSVVDIKSAAFMDCVNLRKVIINDSVTKIGSYAFYGCSMLEEIKLPKEVEIFGSSIFGECRSLTEVTLPKGVTKIYSYTFDRCTNLKKVYVQENITEIWHNAFNGCSKLEFFDLSYVEIYGDWSMASCSQLTNLDLSNTKEIGSFAFRTCYGLTEVEIPTTVNKIGEKAFGGCKNTVLYIEDEEYKETWHQDCFLDVKYILGAPTRFKVDDFIFIQLDDDTLELVSYKGNEEIIEIPEIVDGFTVSSIGERVFYMNKTLEEIIMPNTIETIKKEAFANCFKLNNVIMPTNLKEIGEMSFWQCHSLTNLKLNSRIRKIGVSAFGGCDIYSIILPSSLEEIGSYAFSSNYHLVEVFNLSQIKITLEGSYGDGDVAENALQIFTGYVKETSIVKTSDGFIYYHNKSTNRVTLINYFGNSHFLELPLYVTLQNNNGELQYYYYEIGSYAFYKNKIVTKVIIPGSITNISDYAFEQCINLTSIVIPNSITSIGKGAFGGCKHLYEIYNLSSLEINKGSSDYGYIGYYAKHIYNSIDVKSKVVDGNNGFIYYIDDDVSYIIAYYGNDLSIVLPTDIFGKAYYLGPNLFKDNEIIESIEISNNVIGILSGAFSGCINIKQINIPQSVKIIESFSFYQSGIINIIFEDTKGWYYSDQYGNITIVDVTLSNVIANMLTNGSVRLHDLIKE